MQYLLIILSVSLTSVSCKNNPKPASVNIADTIVVKDQSLQTQFESTSAIAKSFDWTKAKLLKEKLKDELQNPNHIDKTLMNFLNEYEELEYAFNDILMALPSYDSLNTLAYAIDEVYDNAIQFNDLVEKNGFSIAQSEGMIYLTMNTRFVKSGITELLDPISAEFLNLYCNEIDSVSSSDGAIVISEKELVNRALLWGNLMEKSYDLEYNDRAKSNFYNYLSMIYFGLNNTPSFDYDTGIFNKNLYENMNGIIEQYPNSIAAHNFKEYTDLLALENFKQTDKVLKYVNDKLESL